MNEFNTNQLVLGSLNSIRSFIVKGDLLHALKEVAVSEQILLNAKNNSNVSDTAEPFGTKKHGMTRFELEDAILDCWGFKEDIGTLLVATNDDLSHDELQNALIGLQTIYNMKFQQLWNIFEAMIENGEL